MYYTPPGMCLNDFAVLPVADGWSVLHLQAPPVDPFDASVLETSFGRAFSPDLLEWEPRGPVFGVGRPGRFDDSAIWTMSHVDLGSGLAMFYTGVSARPRGRQAVGLAVSDRYDGTGWQRVGHGPVTEADPRWYRTDADMAWRDPFVVHDPDGFRSWVMVVCARVQGAPPAVGGCVGLATSDDLENWTVREPLLVPGDVDELECPVLERVADGWLLLGGVGRTHTVEAWFAEKLTGEWRRLGRVAPPGPYAPRLVDGIDGRLVLHTLPRRAGLDDAGAMVRGVLAPPKLWHTAGGVPELQWWPGTETCLGPATGTPVRDGLMELAVDEPELVTVRIGVGGPETLEIRLSRIGAEIGYAGAVAMQRLPLRTPVRRSVRVMRAGEFVEVYLDGRLSLSAVAYARLAGAVTARVDALPAEMSFRALDPDRSGREGHSAVRPSAARALRLASLHTAAAR